MPQREEGDFGQLKALWYQKLKDSGFDDAENEKGYLKDWPTQRLRRDYTPERFREKQEYYRLACQFLHEHSFDSAFEKTVWELHALGLSIRDIVFDLKDETNHVNKDNIQKITRKYGQIIYARLMRHDEE